MRDSRVKRVAYMGLMLALVLALSFLERLFPPLPMLPPGVNLGLSNIITMYCVFFLGSRWAFGISILKSLFAVLTRGAVAGLLSLCGGVLSIFILMVLLAVFKHRISYAAASICGAVAHNIGQISAAAIILSTSVFFYIPVLVVSGVIMGAVTGVTLNVLLPVFHSVIGSDWSK